MCCVLVHADGESDRRLSFQQVDSANGLPESLHRFILPPTGVTVGNTCRSHSVPATRLGVWYPGHTRALTTAPRWQAR